MSSEAEVVDEYHEHLKKQPWNLKETTYVSKKNKQVVWCGTFPRMCDKKCNSKCD